MKLVTDEEIETLKQALEIARRLKNGGHKGNVIVALRSLHVTSRMGDLLEKLEEDETDVK